MPSTFVRVALIAGSLGFDTFAVSIGIGMGELSMLSRVRVALAFASAEVGMTFIGTLVGRGVQQVLGDMAGYLGFTALVLIGVYMIVETVRGTESSFDLSRGWGLLLASLSISLDALGIGFSIPYLNVPFGVMFAAIALASGSAAALGLSMGRLFGSRVERASGTIAGIVLILTGLTFAFLHYEHIGLE
jgi:putative Mn2+ efflux pump MntP